MSRRGRIGSSSGMRTCSSDSLSALGPSDNEDDGEVAGTEPKRGAGACLGMFTLADFDAEVADLDIGWTVEYS